MAIELVEILGRAKQGVTEPFICRGDDENIYYVKGNNAGKSSLIKELICGQLAKVLGLPVAPFEVVSVSQDLIGVSSAFSSNELGAGPAFGSLKQDYVSELTLATASKIPLRTRMDIAVFDRWILNSDRTLTEYGGNPNLLWSDETASVLVIDHNNSFDLKESVESLIGGHIFKKDYDMICQSPDLKLEYAARLDGALTQWAEIEALVPDGWLFVDGLMTVPTQPQVGDMFQILTGHRATGFWS